MSTTRISSAPGKIKSRVSRPTVFLEEDCPIAELSVESRRERGASSALPPLYFLHVWWARRPLSVSRAAVLGSLLPADFDRKSFLRLNGILGDPVADRRRIDEANRVGKRLDRGFGHDRAFKAKVPEIDRRALVEALERTWGNPSPTVLDSFAGGGSIPFEAFRMGCTVISNELSPVATIIERATIEYPSRFGPLLGEEIQAWGERIAKSLEKSLARYFPKESGESIFAYIWVRTVACKDCELLVPLSPNWWLDNENTIGFQLAVPATGKGNSCTFRVARRSGEFDPDKGTVSRGAAVCPRCSLPLDEDYIKAEAQAGRLGQQLAMIGFKKQGQSERFFRPPTDADLTAVNMAQRALEESLPKWRAKGFVPEERVPDGTKTRELLNRGMTKWSDVFSPRQLLVHLTTLETILEQPWDEVKDPKKREALRVYMAFAMNKGTNYGSLQSLYNSTRTIVKNTFDRHDFAFIWQFGEIDGSGVLYRWGTDQVSDAYREIAKLLLPTSLTGQVLFHCGDARSLPSLANNSAEAVVIDPPYYDNVMYAELADFFYVWEKRSLGDVFPELFHQELTDKDDEAVANTSRFRSAHRGRARELAKRDYEAKMQTAFQECRRVLRDDGVLTIMFTHKKVEAWDTLSSALFEAGFEVTASWPIHTESEHSLHQAKKNAAASTILLICRKRPRDIKGAWWEDLREELDRVVHVHAEEYLKRGMRGQDIFIAAFGPALKVISAAWPVRTKDGKPIRPDDALNRARRVVADWYLDKIAEGKGQAIDAVTRFYILAWHVFQAREFPFDEARKLALSLGVEVDHLTSRYLIEKRGQGIRLVRPEERITKRALRPEDKGFDWDVDYVQAAIATYQDGKGPALARFHTRTGALQREGYRATIGLLLDVLPRAPEVTEYQALEGMWQSALQTQVPRRARTDPTGEMQSTLEEHDEGIDEDQAEEEE